MLPELVGDDAAARMFKREARIMGQLRHPGIVSVFDFGREEQSYLLVMDYVHGFHLGRWASWTIQQQGRVPVVLAVQIVIQVLEALHHAHTLTGEHGEPMRLEATGIHARILQHEADHLDGVLMLDRTVPEQKRAAVRALNTGESYRPPRPDPDEDEIDV